MMGDGQNWVDGGERPKGPLRVSGHQHWAELGVVTLKLSGDRIFRP